MFNPFTPAVCDFIHAVIEDAREAYTDCLPDLHEDRLRFAIGNASDYGRMKASAATGSKISTIFIPTSNAFSPLHLTQDGFDIKRDERGPLHGLLMHELGHVAVGTAKKFPWKDWKAGHSTHTLPNWIWVCQQGWQWHHKEAVDANAICRLIRLKSTYEPARTTLANLLSCWEPQQPIPDFSTPSLWSAFGDGIMTQCVQCGIAFEPKARTNRKTCSTKCRVAYHRASTKSANREFQQAS